MPPRAIFTEAEHNMLVDNCMKRPLKNIAADIGRPYNTCKNYLTKIGVIIPVEVTNHFKRFHTDIGTPPRARKSYYVKKGYPKSRGKQLEPRAKAEPARNLPKDMRKVKEPEKLPNKSVDYSTKRMVRVDNKTWVYVDK